MKKPHKIMIVAALVIAVGFVFAFKSMKSESGSSGSGAAQSNALPRLVDLGSVKCIPCKAMAPILDELKREYAGRLTVEFFDIIRNPEFGDQYGVQIIPTQIFYDAQGRELFRNEGFISKEDILAKWKELGVELNNDGSQTAAGRRPEA